MQPNLDLEVPPEVTGGHFADFAGVWHSSDVFVLDFASLVGPPRAVVNERGETQPQISARVVSRIRVPPSQIFELMKALERELTAWEQERAQAQAADSGD